MILLLSNKWDLSIDFIVLELSRRQHSFLRVNSEDLLGESVAIGLPGLEWSLSRLGERIPFNGQLKAVLNRRPGKPFEGAPAAERPSAATGKFLTQQWHMVLESLEILPNVLWINDFRANLRMENKLRQLALAHRLGFRIPETLVTNDGNVARTWLRQFGGKGIVKAVYAPLIEEPEFDSFIFTHEISIEELDDDAALRLAPAIFQRALIPKVDYRVTVIGSRVFTVRIETPSDFVDWRRSKESVRVTPEALPRELESRVVEYVRQANLRYGAIDFIFHNDEYFFVEINPNGEWGWLQKPHGLPIAETICDELIAADRETISS